MIPTKITNIILPLITVILIFAMSLLIIAYGRGYRLDFRKKSVGTTGLIAVTSDPIGAQIFINGQKKEVTNTNLSINPGWYTVTIMKNGYQSWEKYMRVQGEIVTRVDAMLFSSNPSLYALTTSGVIGPTLSPDGAKLAYLVPELEATMASQITSRAGIWVLDLVDKPLGMNRDARQVLKASQLNLTDAALAWSPDSKQLLITNPKNQAYLIEADKSNDFPKPVTDLSLLYSDWKDLIQAKEKEKLLPLKEEFLSVATTSMDIIAFSPDESRILYEATAAATIPPVIIPALPGTNPTEEVRDIVKGNIYVYDVKEDRNYFIDTKIIRQKDDKTKNISDASYSEAGLTVSPSLIQWLTTSRHLMIVEKDKVEVLDYDGTNKKTVYAGPFWNGFVAPWGNAGRIVILTNLNPSASAVDNLYAVNIR